MKRELALVKVRCEAAQRRELSDLAAIFHGTICDVSLSTVTLEMQGKETKIGALQGLLAPYGASHEHSALSDRYRDDIRWQSRSASLPSRVFVSADVVEHAWNACADALQVNAS